MSAEPQIVRQWLILRQLSSHRLGLTVRALADELHVTEKTIRRDLETLQGVGFGMKETVGEHGRKSWQLESAASQAALAFTFDELLSMYLGRRFLDPLAGTFLWQAAQNAFQKIRASVAPSALKYLEKMVGRIHLTAVGAGDYSTKGEIFDRVQRGVEDSKAVLIAYRSQRATEPVTYEVFPYALTNHRGSYYLTAHSRDHGEVRQFKLDRIESAEVTEFPFHRPEDFNVSDYFRGSFGVYQADGDVLVKVRFLPAVARYVRESRWHASQQLSPQKDGSVLAEFRLSSIEEIKHWLLSFGGKAIALEPFELRQEIAAELHEMLVIYGRLATDGEAIGLPKRVPDESSTRGPAQKQRLPVAKSSTRRESRNND